MGRFFMHTEDIPLTDQIRSLGDDELLDFWEETQYLEKFLEEDRSMPSDQTLEYERIILQELQLRSCLRIFG